MHFRGFALFSAITAVLIFFSSVSHAATSRRYQSEDFWDHIMSKKDAQFTDEEGLNYFLSEMDAKIESLESQMDESELSFNELYFLMLSSMGYPYELAIVFSEATNLTKSFKKTIHDAKRYDEMIESINHILDSMMASTQIIAGKVVSEKTKGYASKISERLSVIKSRINANRERLRKDIEDAEKLHVAMVQTLDDIHTRVAKRIHDLVFSPRESFVTHNAIKMLPFQTLEWCNNLSDILLQKIPDTIGEWSKLAFMILLILIPGFIFSRRILKRFNLKEVNPHAYKAFQRAVWLIAPGVALTISSIALTFPETIIIYRIGLVFLARGFLAFTWGAKSVLSGVEGKNPLALLCALYIAGTFYQVLDFPYALLAIMWPISMLAMSIGYLFIMRQPCPKVERIMKWIILVSGFALCAFSLSGYVHLSIFALNALFVGCILFQFGTIANSLCRRYASLDRGLHSTIAGILLNGIGLPIIWLMIVGAFTLWIRMQYNELDIFESFFVVNWNIGSVAISAHVIIAIVFMFFVCRGIYNVIKASINSLADESGKGFISSLSSLMFYVIWGSYLMIVLWLLGIRLANFAFILGGISLGIGFGLQNIINNFISGLIVIFGRNVSCGDIIQIGDTLAKVRKINIRTTEAETMDKAIVSVPNADLLTGRVINWTMNNSHVRKEIPVEISISANAKLFEQLIMDCLETRHPHILKYPAPALLLNDFSATTQTFLLRIFIDDIEYQSEILSELRKDIMRILDENKMKPG